MGQLEEIILGRRTIHNYKPDTVPDEIILKAIELAVWVPNHKRTFPWRFVRVGAEIRKSLLQVQLDIKKKSNNSKSFIESAIKNKFLAPPELIVLCQKQCSDLFQKKEDYASVACGVQNMSLYLSSHGVGSKWSTGEITRAKDTYKILNIDSNQFEIVGFFWCGYPDKIINRETRPSIDKFLISV